MIDDAELYCAVEGTDIARAIERWIDYIVNNNDGWNGWMIVVNTFKKLGI